MQITTKLRKTVTTIGLTAIGLGAAVSTAPSASALVTLPPGSITTAKVTILDYDNIDHASSMPDPTQTGGGFQQHVANPDVFVNPPRIHANDQVAVCATFVNPGFTKTAATPFTITGPSYNLTGTVPALTRNAPTTVCSGYYHLNFPSAAACGITLTVTPQGYAPKSSRTFRQANPWCPTPINRAYDLFDNGNRALVLDFNNVNHADVVNGAMNPDRFIDPAQIHANDKVNVCTTFVNPDPGAGTPAVIVSGTGYGWRGAAPVVAAGTPQTVCTGFLHLNWQGLFPAPTTTNQAPCAITLNSFVAPSPEWDPAPVLIGSTRMFTQVGVLCDSHPLVG